MNRMSFLYIAVSLVLTCESMAAVVCYSEDHYPALHLLGLNDKKFPRLALVGKYADRKNRRIPFIEKTDKGWVETIDENCKPFYSCLNRQKSCHVKIPEIKLSIDEIMQYRNLERRPLEAAQGVSACVEDGDNVYFGVAFYEGEGVDGVGGIGKYNVKTKQLEVRRLSPLINTSVTGLVFDGKDLWVSGSSSGECLGDIPVVPLMKYNWDKNIIVPTYENYKTGSFCGFNVHDMIYDNDTLYIGSDMGLSIAKREKVDYGDKDIVYEWTNFRHYIPDLNDPMKMVETSCGEVYEDLLNNIPEFEYKQLIGTLIRFKPEYMKRKFIKLNEQQKDKSKKQ